MSIFVYSIFIFLILTFLLHIVIGQEKENSKIIEITLNTIISGKMIHDDSYEYYKLKLPNNIKEGSLLVFTVKESHKGIREGEDIFSDPDIYISKSKIFPSNKEDSDWYSERYGSDILTIPSEAVNGNAEFFIGMYCQYKCGYELNSYLTKEAEIKIGQIYMVNLKKESSLNYYVHISKDKDFQYQEFNLIATSPALKSFRIFMSKNSPSSQNTFQIIPSWTGGYMITVNRKDKDYCVDCNYHIMIQSQDEKIEIQFYAFFQNTITTVKSGNLIYDAVKNNAKRCYSFDTKFKFKDNEKLIIQTTLFSGSALIHISGWLKKLNYQLSDVNNKEYSYQIQSEKIIMLKKEDLEQFDSDFMSENKEYDTKEKGTKGILYFCVYGEELTSFIINIYFLSQAEMLQKYNYISPGTEITGYLQGGQMTRYRILDFNRNKNSNITLTFTNIQGNIEFYGTFCTKKCMFNNDLFFKKMQLGELIKPKPTTYLSSSVLIEPKQNQCYMKNDDKCKFLALIKCNENNSSLCSFKILVSVKDKPIFMTPKKAYYNIIPKGKTDYYEIIIDDIEVTSIVIVLTTVTGDAELAVYKKTKKESYKEMNKDQVLGMSSNKDYIPDVLRITPQMLKSKNVAGSYIIKVIASSFSSYNLYYYTTRVKPKEEKSDFRDVTMVLNEGKIIIDYFPNNINYKIYSYTPDTAEKKDIKFVLTRINVGFSFKIYTKFDKIKYRTGTYSIYDERLTGYEWASDQSNEVTISKNDPKYSEKGPYYIVVFKNIEAIREEEKNKDLDNNALMSYYIGVTKFGIPFTLYETIEHSQTLTENYKYQNYWYIHNNYEEPFQLNINVLSGAVDVYVNIKEIPEANLSNPLSLDKKLSCSIVVKKEIDNFDSIILNNSYFKEFCQNFVENNFEYSSETCSLIIYVVKSKSTFKYQTSSQYIIAASSSIRSGQILLSGKVTTGKVKVNDVKHYFIEEVKHRKGSSINIKFTEGYGEIYVRILEKVETGKNIIYPDCKNYDYKGVETYMGKIVIIPSEVFEKITKECLKLKILITIEGTGVSNQNIKSVKYSLSYSSEPKRINQNIPYSSFITSGESQYFTFYFDEKTENIYISLSNMNGDADLYLNYGNDKYPTPNEYDWSSTNLGHEYIDINKNDPFFIKNVLINVSGYYTLLVVGFTDTRYTLFVSSHEDNIFPLMDNKPISCKCERPNDKCFFRYDNVFKRNSEDHFVHQNEIIFTSQYLYGDGKMFANLLKDQELSVEQRKKYIDFFPNNKFYQFSNSEEGKRNYLKIEVPEFKYSEDSLILMSFICDEKTDVEITATSLAYKGIYTHLDSDRENIYYIKYNNSLNPQNQIESLLTFYARKEEDIIYEFHSYLGKAHIKVFTNESLWDPDKKEISYIYQHISEFVLKSNTSYEYSNYKVYTQNYFNSISKSVAKDKKIYFGIKPLSDFGFYLQILYDRTWINVPIGKEKSYFIINNIMYGYFDIHPDFSNIEINLSLNDFIYKAAKLFIKLIVISKESKNIKSYNREDKLYHYEIPSSDNHDYYAKTDKYLGTINININNLPKINLQDRYKKIIRGLFCVEIVKNEELFSPSSSNNEEKDSNTQRRNNKDSTIYLSVNPGVNNFKRVEVSPYTYYFSNITLINRFEPFYSQYAYNKMDGNKEIKIYNIDKVNSKDNKMIIQINSCSGEYEVKFSSKVVTFDDNQNDIPYQKLSSLHGRNIYLLDRLKSKHIYLSVKPAQIADDCYSGKKKDSNNVTCSNELSYLLYYYSTSEQQYFSNEEFMKLTYREGGKNKLWVKVPKIKDIDYNKNLRKKEDIEYNLFWTKNSTFYRYMESICYLSQLLNNNENVDDSSIHIMKNIKLSDRNELLIRNIGNDDSVYLNVLVRNLKTNELFAFKPIRGIRISLNYGLITFLIILIIIVFINYYCYDCVKSKFLEIYEKAFSKISNENKYSNEAVRYTNLSDEVY